MKLSKERFLNIISYISAYYTNFKFEIKDSENKPSYQFKVWYDVFKSFEEESLVNIVRMYCQANTYPPTNPTQILEFIKEKVLENSMSANEAWQIALETLREKSYDFKKVEKKLLEYNLPLILHTINDMKDRFYNLYTDNIPYVRKEFIEIYNSKIKVHSEKVVKNNLIGFDSTKLLEQNKGDQ